MSKAEWLEHIDNKIQGLCNDKDWDADVDKILDVETKVKTAFDAVVKFTVGLLLDAAAERALKRSKNVG